MADLKPLWAKDPLVAHATSSGMGDHAALESLEPLLITYLQLLCKLTCAASCTACLRDLASGTTRSSPVCPRGFLISGPNPYLDPTWT